MNDLKQTIATLEHHAEWRLGCNEELPMLPPAEITKALKHAIEVLKLTEKLIKDLA